MKRISVTAVVLIVFTLLTGTTWAALSQTQVSQLYVSIFGRASEGEGNAYWCSTQEDMVVAANTMLDTEPAKAYFGATLYDNQAFIEFIYENTLGKTYAEDPDGVDYWVGELATGKSKGQVVATLINAAMDPIYAGLPAQDQFLNKVTVCNYTADTIATCPDINDLSAFFGFISNITYDDASVASAKASIDVYSPDISGTIKMTITVNATNCGEGIYTYYPTWNFVQKGNDFTVSGRDYDGDSFSLTGTLNGNILSVSGSYREDGGTTTLNAILTVSGNTFSGPLSWRWANSYVYCSGSDIISGVRQ